MSTPIPDTAAERIDRAAGLEKCRPCGCFHQALAALDRLEGEEPGLAAALARAHGEAEPVRYDCLGCDPCEPVVALMELVDAGLAAPVEEACLCGAPVRPRTGWPPLPGNFRVLRHEAPVAVCTLTDENLMEELAGRVGREVAILGTLTTENLGIERIVRNVVANPRIVRLVVCGPDSRQAVGHRPGASLIAFARNGVDADRRILDAPGRRPVLKNLPPLLLDRFRERIDVVDLVDRTDPEEILAAIVDLSRAPAPSASPAGPADSASAAPHLAGWLPEASVEDPNGWFVIHLDRSRGLLLLEHYRTDGTLNVVIEGRSPAECYVPAIEGGMLTRLDHAAYLGRELTRAERALETGGKYVQDSAPER